MTAEVGELQIGHFFKEKIYECWFLREIRENAKGGFTAAREIQVKNLRIMEI